MRQKSHPCMQVPDVWTFLCENAMNQAIFYLLQCCPAADPPPAGDGYVFFPFTLSGGKRGMLSEQGCYFPCHIIRHRHWSMKRRCGSSLGSHIPGMGPDGWFLASQVDSNLWLVAVTIAFLASTRGNRVPHCHHCSHLRYLSPDSQPQISSLRQ